jgi:hypothetical protein
VGNCAVGALGHKVLGCLNLRRLLVGEVSSSLRSWSGKSGSETWLYVLGLNGLSFDAYRSLSGIVGLLVVLSGRVGERGRHRPACTQAGGRCHPFGKKSLPHVHSS